MPTNSSAGLIDLKTSLFKMTAKATLGNARRALENGFFSDYERHMEDFYKKLDERIQEHETGRLAEATEEL